MSCTGGRFCVAASSRARRRCVEATPGRVLSSRGKEWIFGGMMFPLAVGSSRFAVRAQVVCELRTANRELSTSLRLRADGDRQRFLLAVAPHFEADALTDFL